MIKMEVPSREESSFPKEKWKTLIGKCGKLHYFQKAIAKLVFPILHVNNNYDYFIIVIGFD